jgi:hypothetical protein
MTDFSMRPENSKEMFVAYLGLIRILLNDQRPYQELP